ncbi:chaplin family protein [Streptomyces justiciae]|uniref:Chaplin family protein n=1 Tax=Streptomyces justiciae TaxID=2780140 RepID=A0ABU3LZM2_9ACTN|nr:chaplin family protein [Streptomyces justiciae]MDT7844710.1 chaplin family protein [Streptomyces justiciae]
MRAIAGALTTATVAATVALGAPAAQAEPFPCTPPEDACAVDFVYGQPGVGTGNVIQTPVDFDLNVKP